LSEFFLFQKLYHTGWYQELFLKTLEQSSLRDTNGRYCALVDIGAVLHLLLATNSSIRLILKEHNRWQWKMRKKRFFWADVGVIAAGHSLSLQHTAIAHNNHQLY